MTDGKSILSGPVLIEHTAQEQKHLEMSRLQKAPVVGDTATYTRYQCVRVFNCKTLTWRTCRSPHKEAVKLNGDQYKSFLQTSVMLMWYNGEGSGVWRHMSDALRMCHVGVMWAMSAPRSHTPSQRAVSATSPLIVRPLWGISLDLLSLAQQNQLNREIRCINKQCSAWGRPGMTRWHGHLDITLQLLSERSALTSALKPWHVHILNGYPFAFK